MRMTVVVESGLVRVDGIGFQNIDMSSLPADLHAMQWYETFGDEEYCDPVTRIVNRNEHITNLDAYANVLAQFDVMKAEYDAAQAEQAAIETIVKV